LKKERLKEQRKKMGVIGLVVMCNSLHLYVEKL